MDKETAYDGYAPSYELKAMQYAATLLIFVLNFILKLIIEYLTKFEKYNTHTKYISSYAWKLGLVYFLNTAAMLYWINWTILANGQKHVTYTEGGLLQDVSYFMNINLIMPLLLLTFDVVYIWKKIQEWWIRRGSSSYTQAQGNQIFECLEIDIS